MGDGQNELAENQATGLAARADDLPGQSLLPAVVEGVLGSLGGNAFHNFRGNKLEIWRQISLACGPDVIPADKIIGTPFNLERFYCHQVQIAGKTAGEYTDAIRCVLITPEGTAYGFASSGVARDLAGIISTFGLGPYDPPISIVVRQFRTRTGMVAYSIQPAD